MRVAAIAVGAGNGRRFAASTPKQYCKINGTSIFLMSIQALCRFKDVDAVLPVVNGKFLDMHNREVDFFHPKLLNPVLGGNLRQESVLNGLQSLCKGYDVVLVHDACRPFVQEDLIERGMDTLKQGAGAVPVVRLNDSLFCRGKNTQLSPPMTFMEFRLLNSFSLIDF